MRRKTLASIIFICSLTTLCISLKLLWNMGIYVDEKGTSPSVVCGGDFWLKMYWFRLVLLAVTTVISGVNLFGKK